MASIATMEAIMFYRTLSVLLLVLFAASNVAQTDETVDCKKVPHHPNCSPRA
jgi:hypothetical protein